MTNNRTAVRTRWDIGSSVVENLRDRNGRAHTVSILSRASPRGRNAHRTKQNPLDLFLPPGRCYRVQNTISARRADARLPDSNVRGLRAGPVANASGRSCGSRQSQAAKIELELAGHERTGGAVRPGDRTIGRSPTHAVREPSSASAIGSAARPPQIRARPGETMRSSYKDSQIVRASTSNLRRDVRVGRNPVPDVAMPRDPASVKPRRPPDGL